MGHVIAAFPLFYQLASMSDLVRGAGRVALADQGADTRLIQDYLGHRNIQHTVIYTATNSARFERLWRYRKVCYLSGYGVQALLSYQ